MGKGKGRGSGKGTSKDKGKGTDGPDRDDDDDDDDDDDAPAQPAQQQNENGPRKGDSAGESKGKNGAEKGNFNGSVDRAEKGTGKGKHGEPAGKGQGKKGKGRRGMLGPGAPGGPDDDDDNDDETDDRGPGPGGGDEPPFDWADSWNFEDSAEWDFLDQVNMVEEMYLPCPTLRKIPAKHLRTVSTKIGNISRHAMHANSQVARDRAWRFFFLFPRLIFQAPLRDRINGRNAQRLYNARSILIEEWLRTSPRARFLEHGASL